MTDSTTPPQGTWSYAAYIAALKPLIKEAKAFTVDQRDYESASFRKWRHTVSSLCTRIDRSHVDSTCGIDHRLFRLNGYGTRNYQQEKLEAFDRDLRDTLFELDHIVEQYVQFGEPAMKNTAAAKAMKPAPQLDPIPAMGAGPVAISEAGKPAPPEWPKAEKLSVKWIWENIPLSILVSLGAFCLATFAAGIAVGSWPVVLKWLEPPAKVAKP